MEEYRHYYGNCTYDDNVTQGATRFLLRLYMTTLDPAYREPLLKALNFLLISQYPNGAWPQRYPLRYEFAHDGLADYTSYYTMNDNSMRDIINVLIEAYEKLGDEKYLEATLMEEVGTNRSIYQHKTDQVNELGYGLYRYDSDPTGVTGGWVFTTVDVQDIKNGYERISSLSPEEAVSEYRARKAAKPGVPEVDPDMIDLLVPTSSIKVASRYFSSPSFS